MLKISASNEYPPNLEGTVQYSIFQYMPDPFRREVRNIGIVVVRDQEVCTRFLGESFDGKIDLRKVPFVRDPSAYKSWVGFWKKKAKTEAEDVLDSLKRSGKKSYFVVEGGFLAGSDGDALNYVADFLFSTLVGDGIGQFYEEQEDNVEESDKRLEVSLATEFKRAGLLGSRGKTVNPVLRNQVVIGEKRSHTFSFAQKHTSIRCIEVLDFEKSKKKDLVRHAAWTKLAFEDVESAIEQVCSFEGVVAFKPAPRSKSTIEDECLSYFNKNVFLVNWAEATQRTELIQRCSKPLGLLPS